MFKDRKGHMFREVKLSNHKKMSHKLFFLIKKKKKNLGEEINWRTVLSILHKTVHSDE